MIITRRDFLKGVVGMASVLGLEPTGLFKLKEAMAGSGDPAVIWLQGQSCTGCSVSFLNSIFYAPIDDILLNKISLEFHPTLMSASDCFAMSAAQVARPSTSELIDMQNEWTQQGGGLNFDLNGDGIVNFVDYALLAKRGYILIVEGAIPTGAGGNFCEIGPGLTMLDGLKLFSKYASTIIAVGACATFGGMPAARPKPTGALSVSAALTYLGQPRKVINIPGCPIHPDWLVGTIIDALTGNTISLDSNSRPLKYFGGEPLHERCPLKETEEVNMLGQIGCLKELGCKGPITHADCPSRKWNSPGVGKNGVSWCIGAGHPCLGCTEPNFPDGSTVSNGMSPFYAGEVDD